MTGPISPSEEMIQRLETRLRNLVSGTWRCCDDEGWPAFLDQFEAELSKELGSSWTLQTQAWQEDNGPILKNFRLRNFQDDRPFWVIGAHIDTFENSPGANDNGSAVVVLLELLRELSSADQSLGKAIEIVFFSGEEPPRFGNERMGSERYFDLRSDKSEILGMICLDMVGFFEDKKGSQDYPFGPLKWIYGSKANFLMVVSDRQSRKMQLSFLRPAKKQLSFPLKAFYMPIKKWGNDWSDHRSFWRRGIPALLITDTAFFRNPHYHQTTDLPETLDFRKMAELVQALKAWCLQPEN